MAEIYLWIGSIRPFRQLFVVAFDHWPYGADGDLILGWGETINTGTELRLLQFSIFNTQKNRQHKVVKKRGPQRNKKMRNPDDFLWSRKT